MSRDPFRNSQGGILPIVPQATFTRPFQQNIKENFVFHANRGDIYDSSSNRFQHHLPGTGLPYKYCGYVFPHEAKACLNLEGHAMNPDTRGKGLIQKRGCSCGRMECPTCYHQAVSRAVSRAVSQFNRMPRKKLGDRVKSPEGVTDWGKPNPRSRINKPPRAQGAGHKGRTAPGLDTHIT